MQRAGGQSIFGRNTAALSRAVGIGRRNRGDARYTARLKLIEDTYADSAELQIAQEAYWDEVMRPGINKRGSAKTNQPIPAPFLHFLHNVIRNIFLFGYSAYRKLPGGEFVVPSGAQLSIRFDLDLEEWVADAEYAEEFSVIVFSPPTEKGPVSFAAAALVEIIRLNEMHERRTNRDAYNSRPTVFATIDHNAMDTHKGVLATNKAGDASTKSYDDLIETRAEILRKSKEATDTLNRERCGQGRVGAGIEKPVCQSHVEYYVADGRRAEQARHLHGPADELHAIIKQRHISLQAAGVPPQVIGETPTSERVSGAERSTGQAIEAFTQRCKEIRDALTPILRENNQVWGSKMRPDNFERVYHLVTPEAAVRIMSQMFMIDKADFDLAAVTEDQQTRRGIKRAGNGEERKDSYTKHAAVESRAQPAL